MTTQPDQATTKRKGGIPRGTKIMKNTGSNIDNLLAYVREQLNAPDTLNIPQELEWARPDVSKMRKSNKVHLWCIVDLHLYSGVPVEELMEVAGLPNSVVSYENAL